MSYSGLQNKLLEDSVIESFLLESVTPVRIGGYNAQPYSSKLGFDFFRTSSVKGVWRWWARALISGALIELGKSPPPKISDLNRQFLDPLLGSTSSASKITIRLIPHEANMSRQEPKDLDIPRIKLITMGRQEKIFNEKYPIGIRFFIELIKRCKIWDLEERFAYYSI
ncbi:MAG: type III-B CRISPR module RAMP protein Cmr1, partial [Halobacteria archaeon]